MSYKAGIIKAITELKDRTGSSSIAIKKHMQASMGDKKWQNGIFLKALKDGVTAGDFVKVKSSYKLSAAAKTAAKKAAAPKKASAPKKKAAPKKKTAPKKAVSVV
jgi:histone H1/5